MAKTEYFQVGVITTTHGIKGEVKVLPSTSDMSRFSELKECFIDNGKEKLPAKVIGYKFFKDKAILKFEGFDTIESIEMYKGAKILVDRDHATPLAEDEFYIADVLSCDVYTEDGTKLGTFTDVIETGANDVYVVQTPEKKEILIPAIPDCIVDVDTETPKMVVRLMKGML